MEVMFPTFMRPDYEPSESIIESEYAPPMKNSFKMTA